MLTSAPERVYPSLQFANKDALGGALERDTPFRGRMSTFITFTLGETAGHALFWRASNRRRATRPPKQRGEREAVPSSGTARRPRTRRRRNSIARVARRKEIS